MKEIVIEKTDQLIEETDIKSKLDDEHFEMPDILEVDESKIEPELEVEKEKEVEILKPEVEELEPKVVNIEIPPEPIV